MRSKSARRIVVVALTALALSATVPPVDATPTPRPVFEVEGRYRDLVFEPAAVAEVENIQYGRAVNWKGEWEDLLLDVHYVPNDGAAFRPAVVWVHGGYFLEGDKDSYQDSIAELAQSGYVVVSINYRLQGGDFPYGLSPELVTDGRVDDYIGAITQAQHDAQAAIRWVRLHAADYDIDPNRVAIAGHSAGGLASTAVAMNADEDPGNSGNPGPSSAPNAAVAFAGGGLPGRQLHIDPGDAPILFVHGLADDVVPYAAAVPSVCAATLAVGNVCEQVLDPDQGHGEFGFPEVREYLYRWIVQRPGLILPTNLTLVP